MQRSLRQLKNLPFRHTHMHCSQLSFIVEIDWWNGYSLSLSLCLISTRWFLQIIATNDCNRKYTFISIQSKNASKWQQTFEMCYLPSAHKYVCVGFSQWKKPLIFVLNTCVIDSVQVKQPETLSTIKMSKIACVCQKQQMNNYICKCLLWFGLSRFAFCMCASVISSGTRKRNAREKNQNK